MRLICIPLWLSQAMSREGLAESALLDQSALSPFFSKKDLDCYDQLGQEFRLYFESYFGVEIPSHNEAPIHLGRPLECYSTLAMDLVISKLEREDPSDLTYKLVGRHLPADYQWGLTVRPLIGPNSTNTLGLFVYVFEGTAHQKDNANKQFLAELLELLYAHNLTIDKLAMTGFLGAYVKRLG